METLRKYGTDPFNIAVIHGGPGAGGEMSPIARELSSSWGVLEPIQTATSIEGQVDELKNFLAKYATLPVTLIGFSWGAWLSLLFAADYPTFIKRLILVGCGPFETRYAKNILETRLDRLSEKERSEYHSAIAILSDRDTSSKDKALMRLGELTSQTDQFAPIANDLDISSSIQFDGEIHSRVWNQAALLRKSGNLLKRVKHVNCPVIAIHGDYDPHPAEGVEKPLSRVLKEFKFQILKNCGHEPWIERHAKDEFYFILKSELSN